MEALPQETVLKIAKYLDFKSLSRFKQTDRWNHSILDPNYKQLVKIVDEIIIMNTLDKSELYMYVNGVRRLFYLGSLDANFLKGAGIRKLTMDSNVYNQAVWMAKDENGKCLGQNKTNDEIERASLETTHLIRLKNFQKSKLTEPATSKNRKAILDYLKKLAAEVTIHELELLLPQQLDFDFPIARFHGEVAKFFGPKTVTLTSGADVRLRSPPRFVINLFWRDREVNVKTRISKKEDVLTFIKCLNAGKITLPGKARLMIRRRGYEYEIQEIVSIMDKLWKPVKTLQEYAEVVWWRKMALFVWQNGAAELNLELVNKSDIHFTFEHFLRVYFIAME